MSEDKATLRKYLLGNLGSDEAERIALQIIESSDLEDHLSLAESELLEEQLENTLSSEDRTLFFNNFLTSEDRKESLKEIAGLKRYASANLPGAAKTTKTAGGLFAGLSSWFFMNLRPVGAVAAVAIVAAGLIVWQFAGGGSLSPLETEYAAMNRRDLSNLEDYRGDSNVSLLHGNLRDSTAEATKLETRELTETVLFRLAVPQGDIKYRAELVRDGTAVFKLEKARSYLNGSGNEVRLLLPKSVLTKGQYQIRLTDPVNSDISIPYDFAVE